MRQLIERRITSDRVAAGWRREFVDKASLKAQHSSRRATAKWPRVAEQFGVVAVAGNLAIEVGIVPWPDHRDSLRRS